MVLVNALTRLLGRHADARLEELVAQHVDVLVHKYWNPEYGIQNEYLDHNYGRLPGAAQHMLTGHSLESLWMVLDHALRRKDRATFDLCRKRILRLLEMNWDYVFDGLCGNNFLVFGDPRRAPGPELDMKSMWPHCEAMIGCLMILENTNDPWASHWYGRVRDYALRTMPVAQHAVWRQAVDRRGKDRKRVGVSTKRKDNFHQARYMMLDMLCLERMIGHGGRHNRL
jgi:mannose/cellobiose epimerase-like protein (N-acyl-D-glucosamine 2-epimerase family)